MSGEPQKEEGSQSPQLTILLPHECGHISRSQQHPSTKKITPTPDSVPSLPPTPQTPYSVESHYSPLSPLISPSAHFSPPPQKEGEPSPAEGEPSPGHSSSG